MQNTFLENQLKYITDFQLSVFARNVLVLRPRARQEFFLSDCHRMLAAREVFLNPVINDPFQHLLKLFVDSAEQASVFSEERSKRVLKIPEAIDKITVYIWGHCG